MAQDQPGPPDLPGIPGVTFVPIEDASIPWIAWGESAEGSFSFMYDQVGPPEQTPGRVLVIIPGSSSQPCFLESPIREAASSIPTLLIQPILEPTDSFMCGSEEGLLHVCRGLLKAFDIPPERVFLVGENRRSSTALALASNHRTEFGGAILWEGGPGAALPSNLTQTSIALLGNRNNLGDFSLFLKECDNNSVPFKMNSYWGEVQEYELVDDLKGILNWMSAPTPREITRKITHSTYLPRYGRYGWIWITQLSSPGIPGTVTAHWTKTAMVEFKPQGVKRFRVKLDSTFDRYGKRVFFVVGNLNLPITLSRSTQAIEFEFSPDQKRWSASFMGFRDPIMPLIISSEGLEAFEPGAEIAGFDSFTRIETESECAWGNRFPNNVPDEELSDEDLYCWVPPSPYIRVHWTMKEIEDFDQWQKGEQDLDFTISFAPGVRSRANEDHTVRVNCTLPFDNLLRYTESRSLPLPEGLDLVDNLQHLLGVYLSREHRPQAASL